MSNILLNREAKRIKFVGEDILNKILNTVDIVETMNESLWVGDHHHKTIYVNPVFEKLSGYSLQECLGKDCTFFFDEEGKTTINKHHKLRKLNKSSQYEANLISKSGKVIPLLISGSPTKTGGTIGIFTNLSKLKKLADQEKITRQILRFSTEAFVILDKYRHIKLWNNGASRIFGYREEEVINKSIDLIIPHEEEFSNKRLIEEVAMKGHVKNVESRRLTKSKDVIDVLVSVTKVMDENDKLIGYLIIYRDITQQKRTSNELQKRFETIQDAYKELGLQRRHLDYLYDITEAGVSSSITLENLEKLIVSALCLLTKCDGSTLRSYDPSRQSLRLKSCFGVDQKWLDKSQISFESSLAEEALQNGRPIIIDDIDTNPKHQGSKLLKMHRFKTMVLIPLAVEKQFLGSISLYATDPAKFRLIETDFLEKIGQQCSLAIFVKKRPKQNN